MMASSSSSTRPRRIPERTARRHRHYSPEHLELINLAAELRDLAVKYPRFRQSLNRLKFTVELQLAKPAEKERRVLRALARTRLLTAAELALDTSLDEMSAQQTANALVEKGKLERRDRNGGPIGGKGAGKGWRSHIYYQRSPARPPRRPADDDPELDSSPDTKITVGETRGELTVVESKGSGYWKVRCSCGNHLIIYGSMLHKAERTRACPQCAERINAPNKRRVAIATRRLAEEAESDARRDARRAAAPAGHDDTVAGPSRTSPRQG
jgi:hypothetical protein